MFKQKIKKLKNIFEKNEENNNNNKKNIENLVVFIILLIITIIAINSIWGNDNKNKKTEIQNSTSQYKQLAESIDNNNITSTINKLDEYNLEEKLEDILSRISGVGEVNALITYYETSEIVPMYNETYSSTLTEETDNEGGTRKISQADTDRQIIFEEQNGGSTPITEKIVMPKVEGAIIIAKGANNIDVKTSIIEAVSAVTGVAEYKVQVFEMND